jgi:hypothetical protein
MSKLMIVAAVLALLGTLSCTGTGTNSAQVFQPQGGQIQLTATTADTTFTSVEFVVNEAGASPIVLKDENLGDGIAVTFDTTQVDDGVNFVKAYGVGGDGTRVEILDNSLLISNGGGTASPAPSASASSAASGTSETGSDAGDDTDLDSDAGTLFRNASRRR